MPTDQTKSKSSDVPADVPSSEIASLTTGGAPYLQTVRLYFFDPIELGRRIHAREWDGISKPLAIGAGSLAVVSIVFWMLGIKTDLGKFPELILQFITDFWFFGIMLGYLAITQLVAKRSFSWSFFMSGMLVYVYMIALFIFPFSAVGLLVHFLDNILSMGEGVMLIALLFIAPLFGYTIILALPKLLAGVYENGWETNFGVFIIYGGVTVWVADRLFPMWQFQ